MRIGFQRLDRQFQFDEGALEEAELLLRQRAFQSESLRQRGASPLPAPLPYGRRAKAAISHFLTIRVPL